jgi:hypothetical protein
MIILFHKITIAFESLIILKRKIINYDLYDGNSGNSNFKYDLCIENLYFYKNNPNKYFK